MSLDPAFQASFTERYAPFINPLPTETSVRKYLPLVSPRERAGLKFKYPIQLAFSHGQTATTSGTVGNLNSARSGVEQFAEVDSSNVFVRDVIPYDAVMRGSNTVSASGDAASYWEPFDKIVKNLMLGGEFYAELAYLHGGGTGSALSDHIGQVYSTPVKAGTGPNFGSATHPIVQITSASWAAGIWNNAGNGGQTGSDMVVDCYQSDLTTLVAEDIEVEGVVDAELCQVQMFKSGSAVAVPADAVFVPKGWKGQQNYGLKAILANTGSLFGINASLVPSWSARKVNAGGTLTAAKLIRYCSKLYAQGARNGLIGFVHPLQFAEIANAADDLIRFGNAENVKTFGSQKLEFTTAVGKVTLINHAYQKQGQAFFLDPTECVRVGASELTMRGAQGNNIFLELPDKTGSELRAMMQNAVLLKVPAHNLLVTGIVPTGADTPV